MAKVRPARPGEAAALTALIRRSKAHWGYGARFLAACAQELRVGEEELTVRRIVVAESTRGELLGVASLEDVDAGAGGEAGDGPRTARLGLLFVEPSVIGRGVGRLLYLDAVRRAAALGSRRLLIDADPHAAGFYRAMGAVPAAGSPPGLVRFTVAPAPLARWARAWTGGGAAVHVGNVAEFNAQFADASLGRGQRAAHDYSCLAAFYSPRPAALVLPRPVPRWWAGAVGRALGWGPEVKVEVYDALAGPGPGLSEAVLARPALAGRVRGAGLPLVPWGLTEPYARLAGLPWRPDALRYESKSAAHALFARILADGGHPEVTLPAQWRTGSRRAAVRRAAARARAGESTVLKSEHGVGGSGTTLVTPGLLRAAGGARALRGRLPRGPLLVEEYVHGPADAGADADAPRDLTYDGFVDGEGHPHRVGAALMDVAGGGYRGATVGPGVVPAHLEGPLLGFGAAVGRELAAAGHRGWFDVDFVVDAAGRLAPTEANLRLTGPSVAFMVAARLDALRGAGHLVRIADRVELGARLPEAQLEEVCGALARDCAALGAVFVPAIPTGAFDPAPWLGVLVAAHSREVLDAAGALVRERARAVGEDFAAGEQGQPSEPEGGAADRRVR
ncbi:putative N-acetyltransferase YhbS [Streptomyces sp. 3211.6]|uniref:GNAT family N-acetyltransferase n=1 Tax=Streptomyces sp. 3211.6 TaxID=1938845 RepID=UPI000EADE2A1|nr:GNAT family N-acetyltransferase [Streptomyces sp. 3211.6]RKT02686.1 putative N-acetyltransferase YhbS [Streptomyces sp. 3211.6]